MNKSRRITFLIQLFLLLVCGLNSFGQLMRVPPVMGEFSNDYTGASVALSADGLIMAVGSPNSSESWYVSGHVSVYSRDSLGCSWQQMGSDIDGSEYFESFGTDLALSANGQILAVGGHGNNDTLTDAGYIRVFKYDSTDQNWIQMGSNVYPRRSSRDFGRRISLSSNGLTLIAGSPRTVVSGSDQGSVEVFTYSQVQGYWEQKGQSLLGANSGDQFGFAVDISNDGSIIAIGAPGASGSGQVKIYNYNQSSNLWSILGGAINGDTLYDSWGQSIDMNGDGSLVLIGGYGAYHNGYSTGEVVVYQFKPSSSTWVKKGDVLIGEQSGESFGYSTAMRDDGDLIAVGARLHSAGSNWNGKVRFYSYDSSSNQWNKALKELSGTMSSQYMGWSMDLANDGRSIAIGSTLAGVYDAKGWVDLYELNPSNGIELKFCDVYIGPSGKAYTSSGQFTDTVTNADSSTSYYSIDLTLGVTVRDTITVDTCESFTTAGGQKIGSSGWFVERLEGECGCDSFTYYDVTIRTGLPSYILYDTLVGSSRYSRLGTTIDVSSNGDKVAIRSNPLRDGRVQVYEHIIGSSSLNQLGSDFFQAGFNFHGSDIALSNTNDRIAISTCGADNPYYNGGQTEVFSYSSATGTWPKLGGAIPGQDVNEFSGTVVSLSSDGSVLALGAYKSPGSSFLTGEVRVFEFNSSTSSWGQLGQSIAGENRFDRIGEVLEISGNGEYFVVGEPYNKEFGEEAGQARVFGYNATSASWQQIGTSFNGDKSYDKLGASVHISENGMVVAIGAPGTDSSLLNQGSVKVYYLDTVNGQWNQIGQTLFGGKSQAMFGASIHLTEDASSILVGAPGNRTGGGAYLYHYSPSSGNWELEHSFIGIHQAERYGASVSMAENGSLVCIGAPFYTNPESQQGAVYLYRVDEGSSINITVCDSFETASGDVYYSSGNYWDTLQRVNGCDSLIEYTVTVLNKTAGSDSVKQCGPLVLSNGSSVEVSGVYLDTLFNYQGCDSILTIYYTRDKSLFSDYDSVMVVACDSFISHTGQIYFNSAIYVDTLTNTRGCDSLVYVDLTVSRSTVTMDSILSCGEYHSSTGKVYRTSGDYSELLTSSTGCDSLVNFNLRIVYGAITNTQEYGCDFFILSSGDTAWQDGLYLDTLSTVHGCDSVIKRSIKIVSNFQTADSIDACHYYESPSGNVFTSSGYYSDTLTSFFGCDSVILMSLSLDSLDILIQPRDTARKVGKSVKYFCSVNANGDPEFNWQRWDGSSFNDIYNSSKYFGVTTDSLEVKNIDLADDSAYFRCLVSHGLCATVTDTVQLFALLTDAHPVLYGKSFQVFPNPSSGVLYIKIPTQWIGSFYTLSNSIGVKVLQGKLLNNQMTLDISNLPSGSYTLSIQGIAGANRKIIKTMD